MLYLYTQGQIYLRVFFISVAGLENIHYICWFLVNSVQDAFNNLKDSKKPTHYNVDAGRVS